MKCFCLKLKHLNAISLLILNTKTMTHKKRSILYPYAAFEICNILCVYTYFDRMVNEILFLFHSIFFFSYAVANNNELYESFVKMRQAYLLACFFFFLIYNWIFTLIKNSHKNATQS